MRGETVGIIPASDGGSPGGLSGLSLALGGNKTLSDLMWPVLGLSMTNLTVVVVSACSPSELWNADHYSHKGKNVISYSYSFVLV